MVGLIFINGLKPAAIHKFRKILRFLHHLNQTSSFLIFYDIQGYRDLFFEFFNMRNNSDDSVFFLQAGKCFKNNIYRFQILGSETFVDEEEIFISFCIGLHTFGQSQRQT